MASPATPLPAAAPPAPADPALERARRATLLALAALVALGVAWELWLAPTGRGSWAIKVLPLLATLPGLLRQRLVSFRWLSLLVWLYVGEGLVRSTSEGGLSQALAALQTALAVALFLACVHYIRRRQRLPS